MRKPLIVLLGVSILTLLVFFGFKQTALGPENKTKEQQPNITEPVGFNKAQFSTTDPASLWVIANKQHALTPTSYIPGDLVVPAVPLRLAASEEQMKIRQVVDEQLKNMFTDAKSAGFSLSLGSGYRSFGLQKQFYNGYLSTQGQTEADRTSARPGYSEHQTGLAFDIEATGGKCHLDKCFGEMPDGKWIVANAYKYGFIVRYPEGKENVTGYDYEPWHLRYIGPELAAELKMQNIATLEEFFGVSGGKSY